MIPAPFQQRYEGLVSRADRAFKKMERDHGARVMCKPGCSDCCHAVFGLFLVEAAYLQEYFSRLGRKERREVLVRCRKAERDLERLQRKLQVPDGAQEKTGDFLGRERVRCPLLNDNHECLLYPHRPVTCRVYGIPTVIHGKARVCGKAGFRGGQSYPAFNLDEAQRELFLLSRELLAGVAGARVEKASLLISLPKALSTPLEVVIRDTFG